jgi:hypothetical protein
MDGSPDGFQILQSGGTIASQGSTMSINVGTCGAYPALGTYTTAVATISPGCSNADGYIKMILTGGSFSIAGTSNRADEIITFTVNLSGACGAGCVDVLPVELTSFYANAEENSVVLHWHAASEINTKEYLIEKSIDALNWIKMGTVSTNRTYNRNVFYRLEDDFPLRGENYYRLYSIDHDGSKQLHGITSATFKNNSQSFHVAQTENDLIVTTHPVLSGYLNLLDVTGRLIKKVKISENNSTVISKAEVPKGFLLLACENLQQAGSVKVLVY